MLQMCMFFICVCVCVCVCVCGTCIILCCHNLSSLLHNSTVIMQTNYYAITFDNIPRVSWVKFIDFQVKFQKTSCLKLVGAILMMSLKAQVLVQLYTTK